MKDNLVKVRSYIEENLRKTAVSGMPYIDLHDNKTSITAKQNNIVFGRRGSGKSTLLSEVPKDGRKCIEINLEEYKNISFPNIIIKIVELIFVGVRGDLKKRHSIKIINKVKLRHRLNKRIKDLEYLYNEEDVYSASFVTKHQDESAKSANIGAESYIAKSGVSVSKKEITEKTISREMQFAKLEKLKKDLINFKDLLKCARTFIYEELPLYILLDDFYFIEIDNQPYLADILHVLTKGTNIFIKIASIKHRTKIYIKDKVTYQGIEIGHDAIEIDLDYSLEDIDELIGSAEKIV